MNERQNLLPVPFPAFCLKSFSQDTDVTNLLKFTIANPGISYEARIGKPQTLYVQSFMKTSFETEGKTYLFIP